MLGIWLVIDPTKSESIISCNTFINGDKHELWVTKPTGKTMKVLENTDHEEIQRYKDAIDYAISKRDPIFYM
ncbi:hypothetical protein [Dehalobacter sp. 14DCB1]|uniref:hypothetical protein n=1 Tax=Dehalobacter sp. 14DCB1 TaxID=2070227 RepID=UPI00104804A1|nr:hypothetical protein [Dehalobacter sp. 14DCB1]TCX53806.1 hypothetical protein C1I36_03485 [Dehalobacter sp. 14DCB1]